MDKRILKILKIVFMVCLVILILELFYLTYISFFKEKKSIYFAFPWFATASMSFLIVSGSPKK